MADGGGGGGGVRKREDDDAGVEDRKRPRSEAPAGVEAVKELEEGGSGSKRSQEECDEDDVWSAIESCPIALGGSSSVGSHSGGDSDGGFYPCDSEQLELLLCSGEAYDALVATEGRSSSPSLHRDQAFEDWIAVEPAAAGFAARSQCGQQEAWSPLGIVS